MQFRQCRFCIGLWQRKEEPSGRFRFHQDMTHFLRDARIKSHHSIKELRVGSVSASINLFFTSVGASSKYGTFLDKISSLTPLPLAISKLCPSRPYPVTSVQAFTLNFCITSDPDRFNRVIDSITRGKAPSLSLFNFNPVVRIPTPSRFVRIRTSLGFAPKFLTTRFG